MLQLADSIDPGPKKADGQMLLLWAAENGHEAVERLLVKHGADVDSDDYEGRTPLSWTIENERYKVVSLLDPLTPEPEPILRGLVLRLPGLNSLQQLKRILLCAYGVLWGLVRGIWK